MLAPENGVNLRHAEFRQWIIFVNEDMKREIHVADVEASGSDVDTEGWIVKNLLKCRDFVRPDLPSHDCHVANTRIQGAHCRRGAVHPIFKLQAWMVFTEAFFPGPHQFANEVSSRAPMTPKTESTGDSLLRLIC